jgi:hypothetical protein
MYNNQPSLLDNLRKIAKENIYSEEPTKKSHENPLYDLMVNIPEEAAKTDPIGKMKYSYFCLIPTNNNICLILKLKEGVNKLTDKKNSPIFRCRLNLH